MFFVFRGIGRAWVAGLAQLVPSPYRLAPLVPLSTTKKKGGLRIRIIMGGGLVALPPCPPSHFGGFRPLCVSFLYVFKVLILYLNFRFLKVFPYCYRGKSTLNRVYRLICGVACAFALTLSLISFRYRLSVCSPFVPQSSLTFRISSFALFILLYFCPSDRVVLLLTFTL